MHQQIRTGLGKASSVITGGGAMNLVPIEVDPLELRRGALFDLLKLLDDNDFDLGTAFGDNIEGGGEFGFALKDHEQTTQAAALLVQNGYRGVRIVQVEEHAIPDQKGALKNLVRTISNRGARVDEIVIGVPNSDGNIQVQITTIVGLENDREIDED